MLRSHLSNMIGIHRESEKFFNCRYGVDCITCRKKYSSFPLNHSILQSLESTRDYRNSARRRFDAHDAESFHISIHFDIGNNQTTRVLQFVLTLYIVQSAKK